MDINFDQQVAIVTGAGAGLGRTYALDLAARGAAVLVNDVGTSVEGQGSSASPAQATCDAIIQAGGRAAVNADSVATSEGGDRIVQAALDHFGRIDIVINNAGTLRTCPLDTISDDDIDHLLTVHVKGAFNVTRPAFVHMRRQNYGRIVFTASGSVFGHHGQTAYSSAKGGTVGLMRSLVRDAKGSNIKANAIMPVAITRMAGPPNPEGDSLAPLRKTFGNAIRPEFVTPMVTYLASTGCEPTGALFSAVGGRFARMILGMTEGWQGSRSEPETAEGIAAHLAEISAIDRWYEPDSLFGEIGHVLSS